VGVAGALVDRNGNLILTLSDGSIRELGLVVGRDGVDGLPGRDGTDGAPGIGGVGFEDVTETLEDNGATLVRRYLRGDQIVREYRHPLTGFRYRGVYREGRDYATGDAITWGGSLWIALRDNAEKPESGDAWQLAVKKGRDGRDGVAKPVPEPKEEVQLR
jgi:hypothetical protein